MVMGSVPFAIFPHRDNLHLCEIPGRLSISGLRDVRAKCWEVEGRRTNNRDDLHLPDGHLCGWFVAMADDIETYLLVSGVVFFIISLFALLERAEHPEVRILCDRRRRLIALQCLHQCHNHNRAYSQDGAVHIRRRCSSAFRRPYFCSVPAFV